MSKAIPVMAVAAVLGLAACGSEGIQNPYMQGTWTVSGAQSGTLSLGSSDPVLDSGDLPIGIGYVGTFVTSSQSLSVDSGSQLYHSGDFTLSIAGGHTLKGHKTDWDVFTGTYDGVAVSGTRKQ